MKVGTVVVVNETGELGIVESIYTVDDFWLCEMLELRTSKRGETEFFMRPEVTQLYKPRMVKKEVSTNVTKNPSTQFDYYTQMVTDYDIYCERLLDETTGTAIANKKTVRGGATRCSSKHKE